MRTSKKIIAIICAFAIAFSLLLPVTVYATEVSSESNFWQSLAETSPLLRSVIGKVYSGVCSDSPDGKHHANLNVSSPVQKDNSFGGVFCTCEYCGQRFGVSYSDLESSYNDYVQDLPANVIDNNGGLTWKPSFNNYNYYFTVTANSDNDNNREYYDHIPLPNGENWENYYTLTTNSNGSLHLHATPGAGRSYLFICTKYRYEGIEFRLNCDFTYPCDGTYTLQTSKMADFYYMKGNGVDVSSSSNYSQSSLGYNVAGASYSYYYVLAETYYGDKYGDSTPVYADVYVYSPVFTVIPVNTPSSDTFSVNTRAGTVSGDLAVMGDNNTLTKVNTTIVNETTNNYYNPTTGETTPITDWTYNYTDRSYTLNLDGGGTAEVVYGNDSVTIIEGGNTYTYYYYINETTNNNSGSGDGGGGGYITTNSDLWENAGNTIGSLLTIPLRIIKAVFVKVLAWLADLAETVGDGVETIVETILGWFDSLPELFVGFLGFLSALFPYLPEEFTLFLTFGLAAVVIIAIIKALRR